MGTFGTNFVLKFVAPVPFETWTDFFELALTHFLDFSYAVSSNPNPLEIFSYRVKKSMDDD